MAFHCIALCALNASSTFYHRHNVALLTIPNCSIFNDSLITRHWIEFWFGQLMQHLSGHKRKTPFSLFSIDVLRRKQSTVLCNRQFLFDERMRFVNMREQISLLFLWFFYFKFSSVSPVDGTRMFPTIFMAFNVCSHLEYITACCRTHEIDHKNQSNAIDCRPRPFSNWLCFNWTFCIFCWLLSFGIFANQRLV